MNDQQLLRYSRHILLDEFGTEAQEILCTQHGISKEEAYHVIREQAMQKRVTAEEIARSIINANEILSVKKPRS